MPDEHVNSPSTVLDSVCKENNRLRAGLAAIKERPGGCEHAEFAEAVLAGREDEFWSRHETERRAIRRLKEIDRAW